jgi:hypothetical protein
MKDYRAFLTNEMGLTTDQVNAEMNKLYNALGAKTSEAIAGAIKDTRADREKLYSLPEDIAKGDFDGLVELATKYGEDSAIAVEAFLKGDPEAMEDFFRMMNK